MTLGFDNATEQITNGTTEVQLNGGVPLTTPDVASQIVEIAPYLVLATASAEDDGAMILMRIQSDDVNVAPKLFSIYGVTAGDATSAWINAPSIQTWAMNIDLTTTRQARVNYFANTQIDAATEFGVGATVVYDTNSVSAPEQFYQKATNETATGTVDNTRTQGDDITITGGREVNYLSMQVSTQAGLASEHLVGFSEFASSDFLTSLPYRVANNPQFSGLGANASVSGQALTRWHMPVGNGIPIAGRTVINNFFTQNDALGGAGAFVNGVGYIK